MTLCLALCSLLFAPCPLPLAPPPMRILVTGSAGFIGFHTAKRLLDRGDEVVGVDNINDYYDVRLKQARLAQLDGHPRFKFHKLDLADRAACESLFASCGVERVIHLAAQAGVRYSLTNPHAYVDANLVAFVNVLEGCRHNEVQHLVYASSSSVYGANTKMPFSIQDNVDHPVSLYAATKKANELMAHTYSHLYRLPTTGLRFFTVYGPWGRPDMAMFLFTKAILDGKPIDVFNHGRMQRDFTYIDDIVEGVIRVCDRLPVGQAPGRAELREAQISGQRAEGEGERAEDSVGQCVPPVPSAPGKAEFHDAQIRGQKTEDRGQRAEAGAQAAHALSTAPYALYNIGNHNPVELLHLIEVLESALGKKAEKRFLPMQLGDVPATYADVDDLMRDVGFKPATTIEEGVSRFVAWYRDFYQV
jgi:UDP-glucuronate 4-epimerase